MKNQYQKTMVTIMTRNNRIMPSAVLLMAIILFLSFKQPCIGAEPRKNLPAKTVTTVPSSSTPTSPALKPINEKKVLINKAIPLITFTKISVNYLTTNVVVAYKPPPSSMRLVCEFSSSIPNSTHSVDFYINNNKVIDKDKDFDHTNFKGTMALMDLPIPVEGTYTFKCVADSMSISLPFSVTKLQPRAPMTQIINRSAVEQKATIEKQNPVKTSEDSFKLGNKTIDKKGEMTDDMAGASKGFSDKQAFEEKMKDKVNEGVGSVGSGTSLEDATKQFGNAGRHDIPGQNKGGVIFDDGKGTGPNTGGLTDHVPGPKDAAGAGGGYSPDINGEVTGYVEVDPMGGVTAGVKGGVSGDNWSATGDGSYNFGGKSWNAHGGGSYGDGKVGGSLTGGPNQGTKGSVSGSYKGVGTNSNQVGGLVGGGSKGNSDKQTPGDYRLINRTPVDSSNTEQGVKESKGQEKKGDYNTKENNNGNNDDPADKPPKEDTAIAQPGEDGQNDTGGNARDVARVKAAARKFNGDTGGIGDSGWGSKPGANDAQQKTIRVKKANKEAATILGIQKKDPEGDPNSISVQAHGPGASQGVSTDKEILSPTTQPK